ncbi:hypothetical protein Pcinc_043638 [Petrolisthes cinctipes]|uniref:Uncharacterized protein n=1 Tax=Petrolisthes cinctipes TaxID=88211 RepID=A0AAE1EG31_PETCI|nr:hypothetical protein Pcinc_043638 [Petrolisthes cinctipes]
MGAQAEDSPSTEASGQLLLYCFENPRVLNGGDLVQFSPLYGTVSDIPCQLPSLPFPSRCASLLSPYVPTNWLSLSAFVPESPIIPYYTSGTRRSKTVYRLQIPPLSQSCHRIVFLELPSSATPYISTQFF